MSQQQQVLSQLNVLIARTRRRYLYYRLGQLSPWLIASFGLTYGLSQQLWWSAAVAGLVLLAQLVRKNDLRQWRRICLDNFLFDLNTRFSQLEHSAQLLVSTDNTGLKGLQKHKVTARLHTLLKQNVSQMLPRYPYLASLKASGVVSLLTIVLLVLEPNPASWWPSDPLPSATDNRAAQARLIDAAITITAPAYTGLPVNRTKELDITAPQGASITWSLTIENANQEVTLQLADGPPRTLSSKGNQRYQLSFAPTRSGVYRLKSGEQLLGSIHSLVLTADTAPQIRVLAPQRIITEVAKSASPIVQTEVQVSDDFAVSRADILASVAKGSGEAVKFRDQVFAFDSSTLSDDKRLYNKRWSLTELEMEPGDELYFTIRAWDNRQPEAQMSRSQTYIFRWLDEEQLTLTGDGILIDALPEYFKSQRQIIIETKQLISDRSLLSKQQFDATSRSLGHAQSDLKLKYGQYLGDEFDDGSGGHSMEQGPALPQVHTKDGDHNDHQQHDDSVQLAAGNSDLTSQEPGLPAHEHQEHSHQDGDNTAVDNDRSGYQGIIQQYGHNHGDTDIGLISAQSPKSLMKQAIAFMWDAELQLMLSAPEKALPYEEQALTFLNRAKKAERIYIKRLGFEPPPVTEARRYQADLSAIREYQQQQQAPSPEQLNVSMSALSQRLVLAQHDPRTPLSPQDKMHLQQIQHHWREQASLRPALLTYLATIENMLVRERWQLSDCQGCVERLLTELWSQLPAPVAMPARQSAPVEFNAPLRQRYQQFLQTQEASP